MFCKPLALALAALCAGTIGFAAFPLQGPPMPEPTPEHEHIVEGAGEWEGTMTMHMPGMPQTPVPAHESNVAIGGFWLQSTFKCELMGMPYLGTGCVGYDESKKKYVGTWIDNASSHLAIMEGEIDPKTEALVMRWTAPDMATGKPTPHRYEAVHEGDAFTSTFYAGEGAGTRTMVISMKRKGAKAEKADKAK